MSATVKASQDPQILRGLTYASSSYVCVRTNSTHMHAIFNACTSHIHHRPCRSFISPLHPPPPLMWDTLESEEYSPGERNSRSALFLLGRVLPLIPVASLGLSQPCSLAFNRSLHTSPTFQPSFSANIHYKQLFSSSEMKVIIP